MELVYLWVEEYKNIKRQGFNFSSRFKCEFKAEYEKDENENEVLKNNCELVIKENKDYMSIFPENINVTAIVGENGSGKSSIVKLILMLIFYKKYDISSDYNDEIEILKQELENKALFLIIKVDGYKKICLNTNINNDNITEVDNNIDFYSIYFSYMLDTLQNKKDSWMWSLYHKSDNYETPILLTPNKFHKDFLKNSINLDDIEYINIKHSIKFYKKNIQTKINDFFNPDSIKLYSDNPWSIHEVEFWFFGKVAKKFLDLNKIIKKKEVAEYNENLNQKLKAIKALEDKRQYKEINLLYIALKILSSPQSSFQAQIYDSLKKWFDSRFDESDFIEKGITLIEQNIEQIFIDDVVKYNNEKINDCIEFYKNTSVNKEKILNKLLNRDILKLSDFADISIILIPWLDLELLEDNKNFNSLSGGQKLFFTFIVNMMYEVSNLIEEKKHKTINLFLDEVEASYHPNWQKEFIKNISNALRNFDLGNKNINVFFSTHSPFILSDIPKENVIFLEKDEKTGNCINATEKMKDFNTFGANIHTLLSHGFFMKNGLMGEFAKSKINKTIEYLNQKELTKEEIDYCENIISIIGEPVIKRQLQKMLDSKRLKKIDKIDDIERQIAKLSQELESLKNG